MASAGKDKGDYGKTAGFYKAGIVREQGVELAEIQPPCIK